MNLKKIIAIVVLIGGISLILISNYIKNRVATGRQEISGAQQQVNQRNQLFTVAPPAAQVIGRGFNNSAQSRINQGTQEADMYAQRAHWLQIGGIVLIILGIGIFIFPIRK